ncbi:hypothetical protein THF1C08_1310003 [Vibrio jasicida]|uniref:Uncharacterized protein n=1 Tax=Vibrio jasicida TaxID=766224 RepID=A0AAU9QX07_9VIBR|nr:hypothetical protein THF1C08_1310003 [Vibrio jasicida]CAH1602472.1 hypothetical protein THF1A12_590002 [Vibrio jasicida]
MTADRLFSMVILSLRGSYSAMPDALSMLLPLAYDSSCDGLLFEWLIKSSVKKRLTILY